MIDSFVCFQGNITLGLFGEIAPLTVENLVGLMQGSLENSNGYSGAIFHRVIHDFMMQVSHQNLKINMSYFAYACKTEGKNGISRLISELLHTLDSSLRDGLFVLQNEVF